ncbi:hypothetical protein J4460_03130 [Candidatus Woesearchaeota archaeon]|nr:MAG: hypothetical protein QS99_C0006G0047 [archaeon GW2011_AR4]MBS3129640.1 hypothetical protein [Candidatus Woesearchaeota archaeon]HIH37651.1 hypothetical protein [Candidatus Woesearchaeota archaeon]HIH48812.1 hypothetical protein [Candidatus Woesearchaeota archaeon]HIJ02950.1 hypothetical protein [Candidatus Woesearchaeota archaeon]
MRKKLVILLVVFLTTFFMVHAYERIVYDPSNTVSQPRQVPLSQQAVITRSVQTENPEVVALKKANNVLLAICFILMLVVIFLGVRLQQKAAPVMDKYEKLIRKVNRILKE